jgi:hypothetical protein
MADSPASASVISSSKLKPSISEKSSESGKSLA